jgi:hypothetical protein
MRTIPAVIFIIAVLVVITGFCIPSVSAAVPYDGRQAGPIVTSPDLNMTGVNISNHSIPLQYGITPTMIDVKVGISETSLPGPKGEMATGPRSIGFTAEPVALVILVVAILAGAAGTWYFIKRRPEKTDENNKDADRK